jgi:hypothetical protein
MVYILKKTNALPILLASLKRQTNLFSDDYELVYKRDAKLNLNWSQLLAIWWDRARQEYSQLYLSHMSTRWADDKPEDTRCAVYLLPHPVGCSVDSGVLNHRATRHAHLVDLLVHIPYFLPHVLVQILVSFLT